MVTIKINGVEAVIDGGEWKSEDSNLSELLNNWTRREIESAGMENPLFGAYSPSNPHPDLTVARVAAEAWDGEIIDEGDAPEYDPDVIY